MTFKKKQSKMALEIVILAINLIFRIMVSLSPFFLNFVFLCFDGSLCFNSRFYTKFWCQTCCFNNFSCKQNSTSWTAFETSKIWKNSTSLRFRYQVFVDDIRSSDFFGEFSKKWFSEKLQKGKDSENEALA